MAIEDVFSIKGRGTVVTGRIERGIVKDGRRGRDHRLPRHAQDDGRTGVEMFRKLLDEGRAGDNVGVLLRGIEKDDVERGQILCKPGSVTPHKKFEGEVYVLKKEEGGRHTPFFTNYRPQFYMRTTDVTGTCELPEGTKMVMPGDNITMTIELITPVASRGADALRDPRGRPHRRRRHRHQGPRVGSGSTSIVRRAESRPSRWSASECEARNYRTTQKAKAQAGQLELKKHCPKCKRHTVHKETK